MTEVRDSVGDSHVRDKQAHTFLSNEEKDRLRTMAAANGLSQSAFLRALVNEQWLYLVSNNNKKAV